MKEFLVTNIETNESKFMNEDEVKAFIQEIIFVEEDAELLLDWVDYRAEKGDIECTGFYGPYKILCL